MANINYTFPFPTQLKNLVDPTNAQDAATKAYVDAQSGGGGIFIPPIYFTATSAGNNQSFTNPALSQYTSNTELSVFYNGGLIPDTTYTLSGTTLTVNLTLRVGDTIDIIRTAVAGNVSNVGLVIPQLNFLAASSGNGQVFNNVLLENYSSKDFISVFYNGSLLEKAMYSLDGANLTINTELNDGDIIDVAAGYSTPNQTIVAGGGTPGGTPTQLQFNNNSSFGGITGVTSDGTKIIAANANISITGGNNGQALITNGSGVLSWGNVSNPAGANTSIQLNANGVLGAATGFTFDGTNSAMRLSANGTDSSILSGGNLTLNTNPTLVTNSSGKFVILTAGTGNGSGVGGNVVITGGNGGTTGNGGFVTINGGDGGGNLSNGAVTLNFSIGANADLGKVYLPSAANVRLPGGANGQVLVSDGTGNVSWATAAGASVPFVHFEANAAGNNQSFINADLAAYTDPTQMSVFKNGVLVEPDNYTISGSTLTINVPLSVGDNIDIPNKNINTANINVVDPSLYSNVVVVSNSTFTATLATQVVLLETYGLIDVTLPAASANTVGKSIIFKDTLGLARPGVPISINADGSDTIDGNAAVLIRQPYNSITLMCTSATSWGVI